MEHSLNLAVGHLLSHVLPVHTASAARDNDDDELVEGAPPSDNASTVISHALHKLLGVIKQVRLVYHFFVSTNLFSDMKIASSLCILQANVLQGQDPKSRAHPVCMNLMVLDVHVSGLGTHSPNGAYIHSMSRVARPCTDSHTGNNMLHTTSR